MGMNICHLCILQHGYVDLSLLHGYVDWSSLDYTTGVRRLDIAGFYNTGVSVPILCILCLLVI